MRIVYLRKKPDSYSGHSEGGILIFNDEDIQTHYLFATTYKSIRTIPATEVISKLSNFCIVSAKNRLYNHEVTTYKDFLAIPDLTITAEYTSENNPELFI